MIGGEIVGLVRRADGTLLNVRDKTYQNDYCAVRCVEQRLDTNESVELAVGDSVWWQSGVVLWNPKGTQASGPRFVAGKARYDIPLKKLGYSH